MSPAIEHGASQIVVTDIDGLSRALRDLTADHSCRVVVVYVEKAERTDASNREQSPKKLPAIESRTDSASAQAEPAVDWGIRRAIELIMSRYEGVLRLREVASAAGLSPWYFSRSFKRQLGVSYTQYVASLRVARAKALLSGTKRSVTEVCFESGFNDLSHFEHVFMRLTGTSPSQYRRSSLLAGPPEVSEWRCSSDNSIGEVPAPVQTKSLAV